MAAITVFCKWKSNRLVYVLDWVFKDVFHADYNLVDDEAALQELPFFISYGTQSDHGLTIPDLGLLAATGMERITTDFGEWKGIPTLFHSKEAAPIPFDLFGAIFFLISRFEEYYEYKPDKHNRYPATESVLFRNGWLKRPLVDEWLAELFHVLRKNGVGVSLDRFRYLPTYDIDIAYSYKYKGLTRTIGAVSRDLMAGNLKEVRKRIRVLQGKDPDPFDCFDWLQTLHRENNISPVYFMLVALKTTAFDKNNSPVHPAMQQLIRQLAEDDTGMHPSYYSTDAQVFNKEKEVLERSTGKIINRSRQHYLKFRIPDTYQVLIQRGIKDDYSMGYGAHLGFRAGTGRHFKWYDLSREEKTDLTIHPFCFMDSTAHYELKLSADEAFTQLNEMTSLLQKTQSILTTVFHNFSLGTDPQWKGWSQAYRIFMQNKSAKKS